MATLILLPIITALMLMYFRKKPETKSKGDFFKISERVYMTPTGIVDFDEKPKLTPAQETSNMMLDYEIAQAEREFQHREEMARMQQAAWDEAHPDGLYIISETGERINLQSKMFINMIGRRKVIGIRYVN